MPSSVIEVAAGVIDGANTLFSTSAMYVPGSLQIWINGQLKRKDFTDGWSELGSNNFKLSEAPLAGDVIQVYFRPL